MKYFICFAIFAAVILTINCQTIKLTVCGSDGFTYTDTCLLEIAQWQLPNLTYTDGACPEEKPQPPYLYWPVCGSNNVTYNNSCYLDVAKENDTSLYNVSEGVCNPNCDSYEPICGGDGVTYDNWCLFNEAKQKQRGELVKLSNGVCTESILCNTFYYQPLCGSDGNTYATICKFKKAQQSDSSLVKSSDGECPEKKIK
ncbi:serine protease inhibitor dipetalogastin-like [Contarinia nasturtii]|uniref:serine protease inhibitor dipetalogastin-like n=1 Tax=Contarinia nasturtii TaxID=265458 RepID=UPI0012D46B14|nr:serine protease inhibitor dipetalogastin-like [Contarinia nasturtii]